MKIPPALRSLAERARNVVAAVADHVGAVDITIGGVRATVYQPRAVHQAPAVEPLPPCAPPAPCRNPGRCLAHAAERR